MLNIPYLGTKLFAGPKGDSVDTVQPSVEDERNERRKSPSKKFISTVWFLPGSPHFSARSSGVGVGMAVNGAGSRQG